MEEIISVEKLCVRFVVRKRGKHLFSPREKSSVEALGGVSFGVKRGEFVGYIGPNGAGKSTTIKCLSGILTPTSGQARCLGRVPRDIGVVFGQRTQLWWDLPVQDSFDLLCDLYDLKRADYKQTGARLTVAMDIGALHRTPVRQLSLGQRMRCDLAAALIHRPKLLFLDEPTIGLDTVSKLNMRAFVRELNRQEGTTVLLTTHDMADVESLCSRVMLIGHGRLLLDGTVDSLRAAAEQKRVMRARIGQGAWTLPEGAELLDRTGDEITLRFDPERVPADRLLLHLAGSCGLMDVQISQPPLDETVAALYRKLEEAEA